MPRENLDLVRARLREVGRESTRIIAVSKTHGPERISEFLRYGQRDFGENRQNEARDKFPLVDLQGLKPEELPVYHHIGPLQSGNARQIPGLFQYVHGASSVSALKVLAGAALRRLEEGKTDRDPLRYLVQIRLTGEESKEGGMTPEEFQNLDSLPENEALRFSGFMTMGPAHQEPGETREVFARLRELRDECLPGGELSMGMSGDWEIALEEGASMIRLGTILFGRRGEGPWRK